MKSKLTSIVIVSCILSILVSVSSFSSSLGSSKLIAKSTALASMNNSAIPDAVPHIILGTTNHADTPLYQQANKILSVALLKLGYRLTIKTLPNQRSLFWANNGTTDGDLLRVSKLNLENFPNLQQVTEPLFTIDQSVLSKIEIEVDGWNSMKKYSIAYERGTKFIEENEDKFKHVYLVNRTEQAISMVFNDRADLTITSFSTATKFLSKNKAHAETIKILKPPITRITLHVYLNKQRHKKLAQALSLVLKEMKKSGQFQQILENKENNGAETINPTNK
ncbi:MAG: ABC transporter substrate-binding protein [Colwellia sp.]|nr:ABC transporter substrate-binding protein [Colwellia sp.]